MALAELKNARWVFSEGGEELPAGSLSGEPTLLLEFVDGKKAFVQTEQKMLWRGVDAVFLDMDLEADTSVNIDGIDFAGFTDNPAIVQLTKDFVAAVMDDKFAPQDIFKHEAELEG